MINRLRLASGLTLFGFVLCHFANHSLGLVSIRAMNQGHQILLDPWRTLAGTVILGTAALVHLAIAGNSIYRRRNLRMARWQVAQLSLGLSIPLLLASHVFGTRVAETFQFVNTDYTLVLIKLWLESPLAGVLQAVTLLVVWVHACIGLHFWLRIKPWYPAAFGILYAGAVLIPTLALAGYAAAGFEALAAAARDPEWVRLVLGDANVSTASNAFSRAGADIFRLGFVASVAAIFGLRWLRGAVQRRRGHAKLTLSENRVLEFAPGASVLETIHDNGIPHASVCGGRGRCSTCRVYVVSGADRLAPPSVDEKRVLDRIGAQPAVRLACQIRPVADLAVRPLLPAAARPEEGHRAPGYLQGEEREIAIMFADLRGFTHLSEAKLPYDVVFLLNQYFAAMGAAVEAAGGRLDKFIGDGVMALFGIEEGRERGCRAALGAARAMAAQLDELNRSLAGELPEPLRMGIGIHVGPAIVGEMGYGDAMTLTAVGDAVNTASRLEGLAKTYGAQLVVSDDVAARAGIDLGGFQARETEVRGKREPMRVWVIESTLALPVA